ncbi:hypothetical protein [Ponticoccus alexandrii]|uniref:Uncharacterized protein n=1 Tax=Ponticoccus alexandrii TaxID=1943633 RepID=A0ABX7F951_9RHOB|nr:hypothetical protein [Ponticoccus alexandrii]ETA53978.1 hypothetical protein P279_00330 [Rhodobacteraceae bacterium PD-2]QRF66376.1 hypothetical protein GQA70_08675 [Ponticoccus alexandrii]
MIAVKFLKPWRSYVRGETAGFAPDIAAKLIAGGVAYDTAGPRPAGSAGEILKGAEGADTVEAADTSAPVLTGNAVEQSGGVITGQIMSAPGSDDASGADDTGAAGDGADTVEAAEGDDTAQGKPKEAGAPPPQGRKRS